MQQVNDDIQVLRDQIAQMQQDAAAAAAANAANAAANAHGNRVATFSLSPGTVNPNDMIDYGSREGARIWSEATAALSNQFDLDRNNLKVFLEELKARAATQGWADTILTITHAGNQQLNMLDAYGLISETEYLAHVNSYANTETRRKQNSTNLYTCLRASLTQEAQKTLLSCEGEYTTVNPTTNVSTFDGVHFLRLIISKATIVTNASKAVILSRILNLDAHMKQLDSNVAKFNTFVNEQVKAYASNSTEPIDDTVLLQGLLKGYRATEDEDFVAGIERKADDHIDGTSTMTHTQLMNYALKRYEIKDESGTWKEKTAAQKEIVALTAQLEKVKKAAAGAPRAKTPGRGGPGRGRGGRGRGAGRGSRANDSRTTPGWMKIPPKDGEPKTITKGEKAWHWCDEHKLWQNHATKDCRKRQAKQKAAAGAKPEESADKDPTATPAMQLEGQQATRETNDYDL